MIDLALAGIIIAAISWFTGYLAGDRDGRRKSRMINYKKGFTDGYTRAGHVPADHEKQEGTDS